MDSCSYAFCQLVSFIIAVPFRHVNEASAVLLSEQSVSAQVVEHESVIQESFFCAVADGKAVDIAVFIIFIGCGNAVGSADCLHAPRTCVTSIKDGEDGKRCWERLLPNTPILSSKEGYGKKREDGISGYRRTGTGDTSACRQ